MTSSDPFNTKPESERPWLDQNGYHRTYYPNVWGKKSAFTLYSPAADRFLLVDDLDLFLVHETAKILTSKVSTITYILDREDAAPEMDNSNCLEYSLIHKKEFSDFGSISPLKHKQTATMRKIAHPNIVYRAGWALDYATPDRRKRLEDLHEYATFVLRTIHAVRIAEESKNYFPEEEYAQNFFDDVLPESFRVLADGDASSAPRGMRHEIYKILYRSNTIEQALSEIHDAWRTYSHDHAVSYRTLFYFVWGVDEPQDLFEIHSNKHWNKNVHTKTSWVL